MKSFFLFFIYLFIYLFFNNNSFFKFIKIHKNFYVIILKKSKIIFFIFIFIFLLNYNSFKKLLFNNIYFSNLSISN